MEEKDREEGCNTNEREVDIEKPALEYAISTLPVNSSRHSVPM